METIKDVLNCLNKFDFTDKVDDSDYEKMRCVMRILVDQFEDYNISKLVDVLTIVDILVVTLMTGNLQDISIKTDTLKENIIYLFNFKHFVKSNCERD